MTTDIIGFIFPRERSLREQYLYQYTFKLLANSGRFLDLCTDYFKATYNEYGRRTFLLKVFGLPPIVMTNDVANITYVLKTNFENYGKSGPAFKNKFYGLLGDGIFNADGQQWYAHRKTSAHLFKLSEFKSTVLEIFNHDLDIVSSLIVGKNGRAFDMQAVMHKFTLESISQIAFGLKLGCITSDDVQFAADFDYCTACVNDSMVNPMWMINRYFSPGGWKYFYCLHRLDSFAFDLIRARRKLLQENHQNAKQQRNDLLNLYLNNDNFKRATGDNDVDEISSSSLMEPTDRNMRDVIINMVIAGRDTTAQALSWTFYRLCIHPEIQAKVREEVVSVLGDAVITQLRKEIHHSTNDLFSYAMLQQLKYTEAVCMEALRLHPSVPKEAKTVMHDDVLPDGTKVKQGDILSFMPWVMGRDTALWGEDALKFKPERFLNQASKPSPFVFTAFQVKQKINIVAEIHDLFLLYFSFNRLDRALV